MEFPGLRAGIEAHGLAKALKLFESAKKMTPTHPHPGALSTTAANLVLGPAAAIIDRARDTAAQAKSA